MNRTYAFGEKKSSESKNRKRVKKNASVIYYGKIEITILLHNESTRVTCRYLYPPNYKLPGIGKACDLPGPQ